jgi:hypothetical protein
MHKVENPWEWFLKFLPKSMGKGVNAFWAKSQVEHHFGFYCIFINKIFFKFGWGVLCHPPLPPSPPVLIYDKTLWVMDRRCMKVFHLFAIT